MKVGSLFAGIGGFDLAARWLGWETSWYSEIEPYACSVMANNFPDAINHGDITQIRGEDVEPVDVLVGGFPCQDISVAGKGEGIAGSRSGLWSHFARLIGEIHPAWVVAENVSALRSRGLGTVLQDLDALGYDAEWHCIPAAAVGAPHQRDRIWIIAYPRGAADRWTVGDSGGERREEVHGVAPEGGRASAPAGSVDVGVAGRGDHVPDADSQQLRVEPRGRRGEDRVGEAQPPVDGPSQPLAHPGGERRKEPHAAAVAAGAGHASGCAAPLWGEAWWGTEPDLARVAYGIPNGLDRVRCLGNAIVPQVAYWIFRNIERAL